MGETTGISWTHHTANFWMGCQRVSPGCTHCYAETLVTGRMGLPVWGPPSTTARQRAKGVWKDVPRWHKTARAARERRRMFVSSLSDIFEDHPQVAPWRAEALALLESCTSLDVQLLTKRPENIRAMVPAHWLTAWPSHVWVGTTVEDQKRADERIPHLLAVPARVRFLSCEPLLEAVNLDPPRCPYCRDGGEVKRVESEHHAEFWCVRCDSEACFGNWLDPCADEKQAGINWVIVGGESGGKARPFDVSWARSIVRQCKDAGVAAFVKQMGDNPIDSNLVEVLNERGDVSYRRPPSDPDGLLAEAVRMGRKTRAACLSFHAHHGADPIEWLEDLRVQEFPEATT